jgi:hypothetical protein
VLLRYTPEGEKEQTFTFRPGRLLSVEAEAIEDVGGNTWASFEEFRQKFLSGNFKARRAALWIMLKRQNPRLRFPEVAVYVDELDIDFEPEELDRLRERVEKDEGMSDDDRSEALRLLEASQLPEGVEPGDEPVGKELGSDSSTDST